MARITIEDLPLNQDLSEAEAKSLKAGAVISPIPGIQSFSVSVKPPPPLPIGLQFTNLTSVNLKIGGGLGLVSEEMTDNAVAGVRG